MRVTCLFAISAMCAACGSIPEEPRGIENSGGAAGSGSMSTGSAGGEQGVGGTPDAGDIVETILPGQSGAKVVVLCKAGDHSCDEMGGPCTKYGDSCDFSGERGVCGACCDGARGELRCSRIE